MGCGKAHLLCGLKQLLPEAEVRGYDISRYGLSDAPEAIRKNLFCYKAQDPYPWGDGYFDPVVSLATLHNFCAFSS